MSILVCRSVALRCSRHNLTTPTADRLLRLVSKGGQVGQGQQGQQQQRQKHSQSNSSKAGFFAPSYNAAVIAEMVQAKHRNAHGGVTHKHSKRRKVEHDSRVWRQGSSEEVLAFEVEELLSRPRLSLESSGQNGQDVKVKVELEVEADADKKGTSGSDNWHEIELVIEELSSTGDGLARSPNSDDHGHVFVIPFCLPGERVLARVRKSTPGQWSNGDFVKLLQPSPQREGVSPSCKYFTVCSGCQFQMLPYQAQLAHKKRIVERAFRNFSDLPAEVVPSVEEMGASPLQYGYRTKLTPHFDRPPLSSSTVGDGSKTKTRTFTEVPPIGFGKKGYKHVMDIENCPLGTPIVQEGMRSERARVAANISSYKSGATLLLRESTTRVPNSDHDESVAKFTPSASTPLLTMPAPSRTTEAISTPDGPQQESYYDSLAYHDIKTCISAPNALTTEYISSSNLRFDTRASSFFQNNNSILPSFLTHLRSCAQPAATSPTSTSTSTKTGTMKYKYLLDAYCGSGLLSLSLSPLFLSVLGIEIDSSSVAQATTNAQLNGINNCGFIEADAADLFADVPYPPSQTVLVIDPPRKGCSPEFLRQMLRWGPARVCYVSCNVHTLARDVGWMVRGGRAAAAAAAEQTNERTTGLWDLLQDQKKNQKQNQKQQQQQQQDQDQEDQPSFWHSYEIESLKGWDFFPQTGHVEGLCVLNRVEKEGPTATATATATASNSSNPRKRESSRSRSNSPSHGSTHKRQQLGGTDGAGAGTGTGTGTANGNGNGTGSGTSSIWDSIKDEVEEQVKEKEKQAKEQQQQQEEEEEEEEERK